MLTVLNLRTSETHAGLEHVPLVPLRWDSILGSILNCRVLLVVLERDVVDSMQDALKEYIIRGVLY
jgi:hypothetical protein